MMLRPDRQSGSRQEYGQQQDFQQTMHQTETLEGYRDEASSQ